MTYLPALPPRAEKLQIPETGFRPAPFFQEIARILPLGFTGCRRQKAAGMPGGLMQELGKGRIEIGGSPRMPGFVARVMKKNNIGGVAGLNGFPDSVPAGVQQDQLSLKD